MNSESYAKNGYNLDGNCPICGNDNIKLGYRIKYLGLLEQILEGSDSIDDSHGGGGMYEQEICTCDHCGFAWVSNPIPQSFLDDYYKYMSKYENEDSIGKQDFSHKKMFKRQFDFINCLVSDYNSILDIGAATGENLSLYKACGKDVTGIEPSSQNKIYAFEKYKIKMYDMTFEEYYEKRGERQNYDLVFLSHTIEHIVEVRGFIDKVAKIASKYIFIEIPFLENQGKGLEPFGLFTNEHVNYFTINSLTCLMNEVGFHLIKGNIEFNIGGIVPGYPTLVTLWSRGRVAHKKNEILSIPSASKLVRDYVDMSLVGLERINRIIDSISDREKLAVWGTGTHTYRLLGMTKLGNKNIVKFYDSDKKKQGLTMLGKKIQPFDIADLKRGEVETIFISSFGSEDAIRECINREHILVPYKVIGLYS